MGGKAYFGKKATKQAFIQQAPKAKLLHLALHAFVDEKDPMQSALFFSEHDRMETDALKAFEIYALSLKSDLAILSACQSGNGPITEPEGILSLGRAFQYAGCNNLIVTQWKMDDKASLLIMKAFFNHLNKVPITEALRKAKLTYMEQEDLAHPYYWGGWISVGKNSSITISRINYLPWTMFFILLIISFLGIKNQSAVD